MLDLNPIKDMLRTGQVTNAHSTISQLVAEVEWLQSVLEEHRMADRLQTSEFDRD